MKHAGLLGVAAAALLLAGCGDGKLLTRTLPDETRVIDGPTLAVPPDYQLRPPREAADYETMLGRQKTAEAQALITGISATAVTPAASAETAEAVPAGDAWLLKQTQQQSGVTADPTVREALEAETKVEEPVAKKSLWQRWFGSEDPDATDEE